MLQCNKDRLKLNFITVLTKKDKSYLIYSWLSEDDEYFDKLKQHLKSYSLLEIKKLFNNLTPEYTGNIVIAPRLWNRFSDNMKDEIIKYIQRCFPRFDDNIIFIEDLIGEKPNMHERAPFKLFRKFE